MKITFNGASRELSSGTSVAQLLAQLDINPRYVAVELNLEVVPRESHDQTSLSDGDQIEIVTLVGGG